MKQEPLWRVVILKKIHLAELSGHTTWDEQSLPEDPPQLKLDIQPKVLRHVKEHELEIFITFTIKPIDENLDVFAISATYRLVYTYPDDYDPKKKEIDDFANHNAPFNVWPFWRELFHSITGRMDIPFPPLPLYRVPVGDEGVGKKKTKATTTKRIASPGRSKKKVVKKSPKKSSK
ncbi:MAG: protein-export chaperone SecB [Candidatus Lernaella stagnicola]|nr:protein-export chaperone SecB [Candidatus Lernaella stagnicola]